MHTFDLFRIFLLIWLLGAAICFVGFYTLYNKGRVTGLPADLEMIVNDPLGIIVFLFVLLMAGPLPLFSIRLAGVSRSKGRGIHASLDLDFDPKDE